MGCFDGVVAMVDADNDAHRNYLLFFKIFRESIINSGENVSPSPEFSLEIVVILSVTAGGRLSKPYRQR